MKYLSLSLLLILLIPCAANGGVVENAVKTVQTMAGQDPDSTEAKQARQTAKEVIKNEDVNYDAYKPSTKSENAQDAENAIDNVAPQAPVSKHVEINKELQEALNNACRTNKPDIIREIKDLVDVNHASGSASPLYIAADHGADDALDVLISLGADCNFRYASNDNSKDRTPLMVARTPRAAERLVAGGATINATDAQGNNALHHTVADWHYIDFYDKAKTLLNLGIDPNVRNIHGRTPLVLAVFKSYYRYKKMNWQCSSSTKSHAKTSGNAAVKIIQLLIENRADIDVRDNDGCTALYYAVSRGDMEIVKILRQGNADPHVEDNKGVSPFELAAQSGNIELLKLLK